MMYFDHAATSFHKPPQVAEAVYQSFSKIGNAGRGAHAPTLNAARLIYDTRQKLADLFEISDASRIAFTSNATESLNIVISGLFQAGDHVITTVCEHNSVLRPLYRMEQQGVELSFLSADEKGRMEYDKLEELYRENTKAIVITHASNLTGNVTDLSIISAFARRHHLLLVVDTSQTAGAIPISVKEMGIDMLCFTGHKGLMGPQGTGGIYVRKGIDLAPLKVGGSGVHSFDHEHPSVLPTALEAGTINGHGIAGLNAALAFLLETGVEEIGRRERALARRFIDGVRNIPGVILYGDIDAEMRTSIVTLNIGEEDSGQISNILWEDYEICVRAGAHCAPLMHETLQTVRQGAVRFSFSYFNTEEEIDRAIAAVRKLAEEAEEEVI